MLFFGAHVDENMGDRVEITVLGATDLEPVYLLQM